MKKIQNITGWEKYVLSQVISDCDLILRIRINIDVKRAAIPLVWWKNIFFYFWAY